MAHEIEIIDGKGSMFSGENITPWHGLGTVVEGLLTASEALKAAGLDWTVEKQPVYLASGLVIPERFANVRSTDSKPLGIVGGDYTPFQNDDAFSFFDTVVDKTGEAHYTSAGSLFGGSRVFMTAKIGDAFNVCGSDAHDLYMLFYNSHDGSRALTAATTVVRAVCDNTVTMGLNAAKSKWSLRHKTTLEGKATEAREALQLSYKYMDAFQEEVERMMAVTVDADQFKKIIESEGFLPAQKRQLEKNVTQLMSIFENETTVNDTDAKGTGWGAYNTVSYWLDHGKTIRSQEARMTGLMDGFGAHLRDKAHDRILALV